MECPAGKCECVHYKFEDKWPITWACHAQGKGVKPWLFDEHFVKCCPCPEEIQAPKKDLLEEILKQLDIAAGGIGETKREGMERYRRVLKALWPKKGDVDKAWKELTLHKSPSCIDGGGVEFYACNKEQFVKALKEGAFDVG